MPTNDVVSVCSGIFVTGVPLIAHDTIITSVNKLGVRMSINRTKNKVVQPFTTGQLVAKYTNRFDETQYYTN